jgi:hypothetical protein
MKAYRAREREGAEGEREQGRPTAS